MRSCTFCEKIIDEDSIPMKCPSCKTFWCRACYFLDSDHKKEMENICGAFCIKNPSFSASNPFDCDPPLCVYCLAEAVKKFKQGYM